MNIHIDKVHNKYKYCCNVETCHRYFYEKMDWTDIWKVVIRERKNGQKFQIVINITKKLKCDWPGCEFEDRHPFKLEMHKMRAHTGERPFKCHYPGCEFGAVRNYELKCHLLKHTGETPFPCEFPNCGKRFKSQRALDTHSAKTH